MSFKIENGVLEKYSEEPGVTEVVIPNIVTSIGYYAFMRCEELTKITVPDSVTRMEKATFDSCKKLINITVSEDNPLYCDIDGVVFSKDQTKLLIYPRGRSGEYTVPNGVISIGRSVFSYCKSLTNITIPNSVTCIGDFAFCDCISLTSIIIPNSIRSIGKIAFYDCISFTNITIPNSVKSIKDNSFVGCKSLMEITVSEDNSIYCDIDGVVFSKDKTKLLICPMGKSGEYTVPNGVTGSEEAAFWNCNSLTKITIPDGVTSIGNRAFWYCKSLKSVTIPGSVTTIGNSVFSFCESLERIDVSPDNCCFSSVNGKLYNKDKTELIYDPEDGSK